MSTEDTRPFYARYVADYETQTFNNLRRIRMRNQRRYDYEAEAEMRELFEEEPLSSAREDAEVDGAVANEIARIAGY